jgi:chemotaxis protein methyltransferase CheR
VAESTSHEPETEDLEVRLLLEAMAAKYGYDLRAYQPASMKRRVQSALLKSGSGNLGDLQHRLLHDAALFATVLHDLTVQVTEMFRDPSFYRNFRAEVIPVLRTYPLLKIWHAGCSSGEEVYATAILLTEEGLYERSQIYATDLSTQALDRAREGVYPSHRLVAFTDSYAAFGGERSFEEYYSAAYDHIAVKPALRKNIVFFQHDLVSDHVFGEMNVIFCRNVLIYFDRQLRARVLAKFEQGLSRGGYLCLGSSEQIVESGPGLSFVEVAGGQRIYRHQGRR